MPGGFRGGVKGGSFLTYLGLSAHYIMGRSRICDHWPMSSHDRQVFKRIVIPSIDTSEPLLANHACQIIMPPFPRSALVSTSSRCTRCHNVVSRSVSRNFSVLNRPPPNYPGHVPLTTIERGVLAIGSAFGSLLNPRRHGPSCFPLASRHC